METIYVFKTSVQTKKDVKRLKPFLNDMLQQAQWNFDLEDCDRIFRIITLAEISTAVISLLQDNGFECEELTS